MADFITRHAPSRIGTGVETPARINQAEEIVQIPWLYQLALEGRIFTAGTGIAEGGIDSESSLNDQTPSVALYAPSSGTIVLPLYFRAYFDTEGDAGSPKILMSYVQSDRVSPAASTAFTALNCLGGLNPRVSQASCVHTLSSLTGFAHSENVVTHERTHLLDNMITAEMLTTVQGVEPIGTSDTSYEFLWQPEIPIPLRAYSAILFYAVKTGSTDTKWNYTIAWAELDEDTYKV